MITICDTGPPVAYVSGPLMARFERMDLADASIVVMTELRGRSQVLTVDRTDFSAYRRNDRQTINFVAPPPR